MNIEQQIEDYISSQPQPKSDELRTLHQRMLQLLPGCQLWFLDGKDENNRTVSNPNIGYGTLTIRYAGGKTREFYKIGLSANTTGISVYIMGIADKKYLANTYGKTIGKASITGYCIKFKTLKDINLAVLEEAILYGFTQHTDDAG